MKSLATAIMMFAFCQLSLAQMANFYSSPNYSNFVNNLISNSIWKSSMEGYTKQYKPGASAPRSNSNSSRSSTPVVIPEYRRYPAVQFKSTGTRLTLQEYLDAVQVNASEKAELKKTILEIFRQYEAEANAKGYPNDWALAYVSYVGLNSHIYHGQTEKTLLPFEQNVGLRDVVAEYATDNGIFRNVTDRQKQELYELMVLMGGLTYHFYEKAIKANNAEEIKNCRLMAEQNLRQISVMR